MKGTTGWKKCAAGIGIAAGAAVLTGGILLCLGSLLLTLGIPDGWAPVFARIIAAGTVFAAAFVGGRIRKKNGLLLGLVAAGALFLPQFAGMLIAEDLTAGCLTFLFAETAGGITGGILSVNL